MTRLRRLFMSLLVLFTASLSGVSTGCSGSTGLIPSTQTRHTISVDWPPPLSAEAGWLDGYWRITKNSDQGPPYHLMTIADGPIPTDGVFTIRETFTCRDTYLRLTGLITVEGEPQAILCTGRQVIECSVDTQILDDVETSCEIVR